MTPSLKSLRYTTAIAVSLVALSTANQAQAQCVGTPIQTCTGSTTSRVIIPGGSSVTDLIVNSGADITVTGTSAAAVDIGNSTNINNAGLISGQAAIEYVNGAGSTITNSGIIRSTSGITSSDAIALAGGGTFNIINTGTIENLTNVGISNRAIQAITGFPVGSTLNVTNSGTISTVFSGASAIFGDSIGNTASTLDNQVGGMITTVGTANAVEFFGGDDVVTNAGTFVGGASLGAGNDTLTNAGTITGNTNAGAGDDTVTNNAGGTITGHVNLGAGDNMVTNDGTISHTTNTLFFGNGVSTLINTDTISATANVAVGAAGLVNVTNSGTISATTDALRYNTFGVHAGETLTINNLVGGVISETGGNSTSAAIEFGNGTVGNIVVNNAGDITSVNDARAFRAVGITVDSISISNASTGLITGGSDAIFDDSSSVSHTITNDGEIDGNITLSSGSADAITNNAGAMITGDIDTTAGDDVITNSGDISGRISITGGSDTITNSATGVIENLTTGDNTQNAIRITGGDLNGGLDNDGRITSDFAPAIAVDGTDVTGLIDNSGTIEGTDSTSGFGISVINAASDISGGIINQAGGSITGTLTAIDVSQNANISGGITNFGEIDGAGFVGIGALVGGDISGGVTNEVGGVIKGGTGIAVGSSGFSVGAISGGITNRGIIEGTSGTAIDLSGATALTQLTIDGGRIIGDVTDNTLAMGRSPVSVIGSGFRTEGDFTVSDLVVNMDQDFTISSDNVVTVDQMSDSAGSITVSYTHLTLPTICSV